MTVLPPPPLPTISVSVVANCRSYGSRRSERAAGVGGPEDQPAGAAAPARGQRDAVRDIALRVPARRAEAIDAERQRRGEPLQGQVPAAEHARVGQRVKVRAGLLDGPLEALDVPAGVAQRAVDPDRVDGRADGRGELGVDRRGLLQGLFLV